MPLYNQRFNLVITDNIRESQMGIIPIRDKDYRGDDPAVTLSNGEGDHAVLILYKALTFDTIVHELEHARNGVLLCIGDKIIPLEQDEQSAYLMGWFSWWTFRQILDVWKLPISTSKSKGIA